MLSPRGRGAQDSGYACALGCPPSGDQATNPLLVAKFVHEVPKELLPSLAAHLASRITDEFCETFKKS